MSVRSALIKKLREIDQTELEQKLQKGTWHSGYYHRYFEGWTEIPVPKPSGKGTRIRRVYTGAYFQAELSDRQRAGRKLLYLLLSLLSAALYAAAALRELPSNTAWYVTVPEALSLFGLIFLLLFAAGRLFTPKKLTIREYKETAKNLMLASLIVSGCLALCAAATVLHRLLAGGDHRELLSAGAFLLAAACTMMIYRMEMKTSYVRVPNENTGTEGFAM